MFVNMVFFSCVRRLMPVRSDAVRRNGRGKAMKKTIRCIAWMLALLLTAYTLPIGALAAEDDRSEAILSSSAAEPGLLCEDVSARTANAKTYIRSDGLRRIDVYAFELHRQTADGWVERDGFADGSLADEVAGRRLTDAPLSACLAPSAASASQNAAASPALTLYGLPALPADDTIILSATLRLQAPAAAEGGAADFAASDETSLPAASDAADEMFTSSVPDAAGESSAPAADAPDAALAVVEWDVTDAVAGLYAAGADRLELPLPTAAGAVPEDGVVLTVLATSTALLERSGSWETYDSFTHAAVNVNAYNGGLQLEVDCLTSAGGLLPASNSLLYSTFASGAYPVTAVGWTLNVHESVTSDGSGTLLYYDDCRNVRRVYQTETPPENRYAVTRYTSQTGPDYIDYTPATKLAVFNDGYGNTKTIVDGYLHSFSDGSGNTVEYTYEGVEPKSVRLYNTSAGLSVNLFSFTYYSTGSNANLQKIQNLETNESVEFLYDSTAMRLDKIIFRKGTVETDWIAFGYTNGRITTVNDRASSAFDNPLTVQYDSSGRVTALSRPNGAQTSFAYGNDDAKNRLTKISSSYSSYEDTYQVFSTSGCTKSVYSAKRSAAPPVALSTSAVVFDDSGKVLHQGATSFPDNDYNALVNYTCSSQSGWGFVNAAYASYNGSQVIKITGDTGKLNFAHQGVSTSNFKGISSGGHFMVSGWVRSSSSLKTVDTEAYVNTGGASFGMSCVVTYTDGLKQDVRVNADPNNTDWQYVSLLVRPDAAKTISGIAVYCSYDYNKGTAYFDNLSLKAVAGESYTYNDQNAVTRVDTPFGSTVNSYDSNGYRLSNQSVNGRGQSVTYSGNRVTQTTRLNCNNGSLRTNYTYDTYGNVKETKLSSPSLSRGITEKYVYSNGRFVTASYDSRDLAEYYAYGSDKSLSYVRSRSGLLTRYLYDGYGRISQVYADDNGNGAYDAAEHNVKYTYLHNTDLVHTLSTNSSASSNYLGYIFGYNDRGLLSHIGYYTPVVQIAQYGYDDRNNLTSTTLGNGYQMRQFYATDTGWLTAKGDATSNPFYYLYNQDGSLDYTTDSTNDRRVDYTYDVYGRIIKTEQKKRSTGALELRVSYAYDSYGRVSSVTEFDGSSTNTYVYTYYGTTDTVKTVKRNNNITTTYTYDALERLTKKTTTYTWSGGTTYTVSSESYTYRSGQTSSQTTPFVSTVTTAGGRTFEYAYDNAGNITSVKENGVQKLGYTYDSIGQLTRENNAYLGKTYVYTYDPIGNMTSKKTYAYTTAATLGTAQSSDNYTYTSDKLVKYNSKTIMYDLSKNDNNPIAWEGVVGMEWKETKLWHVNFNGLDDIVDYRYSADGLRTKKIREEQETGRVTTTEYYYDEAGRLVYETIKTIGGRNDKITYMYDGTGRLMGLAYRDTPGATYNYFYERNGQGEIIGLFNSNGTRVVEYVYDAWGNCTIVSDTTGEKIGTLNPYRYKDYYYDTETGWYYLNSRYYDPEIGRFISPDAVLGANGDLLSYNRYLYCSNNPVMYADPSGEGILAVLILAGISVATLYASDVVSNYKEGARGADMWKPSSSLGTYLGTLAGSLYGGFVGMMIGGLQLPIWASIGIDALVGGVSNSFGGAVASGIDGVGYSFSESVIDFAIGGLVSLAVSGTYHGIGKARTHSFNRKSGRVQKDMMPDIFNTTKHRGTQIFHTGAFRQSEQFINYMYRGATGISTTIGMIADFAILRIRVVE